MLKPIITLVCLGNSSTYVSRSFDRIDDEAIDIIRGCIEEDFEETLTKEDVEKHFTRPLKKIKEDYGGFEKDTVDEDFDFEHQGDTIWKYKNDRKEIHYILHVSRLSIK